MTLPALDLKLSGFGDIPTPLCTHTQAFPVSSVSWTQAQRGLLFSAFLFGIDTRSYDDSAPLEIIPLRAPKCPKDTWNSPDMDFSNLKISDTHRASRGSGFGLGDADHAVQQHVQSPPSQMENYYAAPFPPMATPTCSDPYVMPRSLHPAGCRDRRQAAPSGRKIASRKRFSHAKRSGALS